MSILFATIALATDLVITAARDAIHLQHPAHPGVSPVFSGEDIRTARLVANGTPGRTYCGQKPAVGVNQLAAAQLYPSLTECRECAARAEMREVIEAMCVEDGTLTMAETVCLDRRKHALRDEIEAIGRERFEDDLAAYEGRG